ncbi:variable surface protein [Plasmodium gonderi]|uniref:Variable surface protein n=1 Tax=Plasmodium gonderi TaxID=77519 RepID=A0A1Y1JU92_PLAGO|nr:variable surface protein [Plasmodium gonderi]GAW83973.1 variable surface protein [Plasmodium gonderi]
MTNLALKFRQLENQYPFLSKVWDVHDNFDEPVDVSTTNILYHRFCNPIESFVRKDKKKHFEVCVKLVRNLKLFCNNPGECKFNLKDCNNLNNWLFISIVKYKLNPYIFNSIFHLIKRISPNLTYLNECPYYFYGKNYLKPLSIVMLNIFESNIDLIRATLIGPKDKIYCSCQDFVYKLVKAYRNINSKYCPAGSINLRGNKEKTCSFLRNFEIAYDTYLIKDELIQQKKIQLPSLNPEEDMASFLCTPDVDIQQSLDTNKEQILPEEPVDLIQSEFDEEIILLPDSESLFTSVSIKSILPTAIVTTASVFSFLFLIYKFNPISNMFHSRKRVKKMTNIYEANNIKALLNHKHNTVDMNSYNQRYDIAYRNI